VLQQSILQLLAHFHLQKRLNKIPPQKKLQKATFKKAIVHFIAGSTDRNGGRKARAIRKEQKKAVKIALQPPQAPQLPQHLDNSDSDNSDSEIF
jgi:hypothetical protein